MTTKLENCQNRIESSWQYVNKHIRVKYIIMANKLSESLNQFIALVPKHLRKYITHGIFIIPNSLLIDQYDSKKEAYLQLIKNTKSTSVNSMHKYTSLSPISAEDVSAINERIKKPLNEYYSLYMAQMKFKKQDPQLFASFAITYNKGHKGLSIHTDDSIYTVNFCLQSNAKGNEVVFNQIISIEPMEDYALIHSGSIRHLTNELLEGERVNIVLWFK